MPETGFTGPISELNRTTGSYPSSVRTRFSQRTPQTHAYAPLAPVLHYNSGQGDLVGGGFWDMRATGRRLGNPAAEQARGTLGVHTATHMVPFIAPVVADFLFPGSQLGSAAVPHRNQPKAVAECLCSLPRRASVPSVRGDDTLVNRHVWEHARANGFVLVSRDSNFGRMAALAAKMNEFAYPSDAGIEQAIQLPFEHVDFTTYLMSPIRVMLVHSNCPPLRYPDPTFARSAPARVEAWRGVKRAA